VYVLTGSQHLMPFAEQSAASVKRQMPALPVTIFTDLVTTSPAFDRVVRVAGSGDAYEDKVTCMAQTPYARTMYLDIDTYLVEDVSELFDLLDHFDVAAAHAPRRINEVIDDVPDSYPEFNTGVVLYGNSPAMRRLLATWRDLYCERRDRGIHTYDQTSFRQAMYHDGTVRMATLVTEYNCRFWLGAYLNQPVKILHAYATQEEFEQVAAWTRAALNDQRSAVAVLGGQVYHWVDNRVVRIGVLPERKLNTQVYSASDGARRPRSGAERWLRRVVMGTKKALRLS
jgi:hypothetical protein